MLSFSPGEIAVFVPSVEPTGQKQLQSVSCATAFHESASMPTADLRSEHSTMQLSMGGLYRSFRLRITPWCFGCRIVVVFSGRNSICIAFRSLTWPCTVQLSTNSRTFSFAILTSYSSCECTLRIAAMYWRPWTEQVGSPA